MTEVAQCPYTGSKLNTEGTYISDWWPNQLNLSVLRQHSPASDPMDKDFDYAKEFAKLNIKSVKKDIEEEGGSVPIISQTHVVVLNTAVCQDESPVGAVACVPVISQIHVIVLNVAVW